MIPRRITVRGFLCYRDEQVIDLDGCDLWVFSGRNGSGKSAVFDAMTYAVFGAHRGGKSEAKNLIHSDASELSVVFEFDLGAARYRVRRGLTRNGRTECQVYRFEPGGGDPDGWPAVPETNLVRGLNRWVQENIGLTYEAFTASILLMQGRAESLLSAGSTERHEILAGVADLARYQQLHKQADSQRQRRKGFAEALRAQLRNAPPVEPAAVEEAEVRHREAERVRAAAEAEWRRLVDVEARAKSWAELDSRYKEALAAQGRAQAVIADSAAIARDWERLQELNSVLPTLRDAIDWRGKIETAETEERQLRDESDGLGRKLDLAAGLADDNRRHLAALTEEIERDEARRLSILDRQAALAAPIQRIAQARNHRAEVDRLEQELASYPADLEDGVARLDDDHRRRAGWKTALPVLEDFARERKGLVDARLLAEAVGRAVEAGGVEVRELESVLKARRAVEESARQAERDAGDRLTEATTLLRSSEDRLRQFESLEGSPSCDRCGQALTPAHFAGELARLRGETETATRSFQDAERGHAEAVERLAAEGSARAESEMNLQGARERFTKATRDAENAERDARSHARACADGYGRLDEPFRLRIAPGPPPDWGLTTFPTEDDLAEGRREGSGIAAVSARLEEARVRLAEMRDCRARLVQAGRGLDAIGVRPGDELAEAEDRALSTERAALDRCLEGHRREETLARGTLERLGVVVQGLGRRSDDARHRLEAVRLKIEAWREQRARACESGPEPWRAAFERATAGELAAWEGEQRSLVDRGVEALAAELPRAQFLLRQVQSDLESLTARINAIPEEARRNPDEVVTLAADAVIRLDATEVDRRRRQGELDALLRQRDDRLTLESQARAADRDFSVAETLAKLLSREGLQGYLLREAEHGILDCANPILDEISGGELGLRLVDDVDRKEGDALPLVMLVRTHGRTHRHDVTYLSGSQKFRVAVSLALAIGQYARGRDRPIQSVIIDEGFGCLDRQGRDEMIEELNALKGRLARVVLVSHQEEFAEAFNDGYHFEVVEGSTVANPFHR